jgi:hypothetical protein
MCICYYYQNYRTIAWTNSATSTITNTATLHNSTTTATITTTTTTTNNNNNNNKSKFRKFFKLNWFLHYAFEIREGIKLFSYENAMTIVIKLASIYFLFRYYCYFMFTAYNYSLSWMRLICVWAIGYVGNREVNTDSDNIDL